MASKKGACVHIKDPRRKREILKEVKDTMIKVWEMTRPKKGKLSSAEKRGNENFEDWMRNPERAEAWGKGKNLAIKAIQTAREESDDAFMSEVMDDLFRVQLQRPAVTIKTRKRHSRYLDISIDLTHSKKDIIDEIGPIISAYQESLFGTRPRPKQPSAKVKDRLRKVYDMWNENGRPLWPNFREMAKALDLHLSTVWRDLQRARYWIDGKKYYKNNPAKRREERRKAGDELCAKCNNQTCYRLTDYGMIWRPCPEYLKIAGKDSPRERTHEKFEDILTKYTHENYLT